MSELKTRTAYSIAMEEEDLESSGTTLVYLKSEADKVIAAKDKEIARLDDLAHAHNIELLRKENLIAELKARIAELEEERRWRKFSEEKPKEKQWILVYYGYENNGYRIELRRWDDGCKFDVEIQELYTHWMPLPSAPKEEE